MNGRSGPEGGPSFTSFVGGATPVTDLRLGNLVAGEQAGIEILRVTVESPS